MTNVFEFVRFNFMLKTIKKLLGRKSLTGIRKHIGNSKNTNVFEFVRFSFMLKNIKNIDRTKISDWDPKTYWEFKKH